MTDAVFVDSNVLIYFVDAAEPNKQAQAERWLRALWKTRRGRLSTQVLSEFLRQRHPQTGKATLQRRSFRNRRIAVHLATRQRRRAAHSNRA